MRPTKDQIKAMPQFTYSMPTIGGPIRTTDRSGLAAWTLHDDSARARLDYSAAAARLGLKEGDLIRGETADVDD
jgi:hypothetical protein